MLKSIIVSLLIFGGVFSLSYYLVGYDKAGNYYIGKQRKKRKSLRVGSPYYHGYYGGSRGLRGGK